MSSSHPPTSLFFPLSLHDALPIYFYLPLPNSIMTHPEDTAPAHHTPTPWTIPPGSGRSIRDRDGNPIAVSLADRSEEHTSELQSRPHLVCRLLLEKKKHVIVHRHP